jgi:hypothetical protein
MMEPITTAIVSAITAGAAVGAFDVGKTAVGDVYSGAKQVIVDTYNGLKALITRKYGADSDLVDAIEGVEKRPDSDARKATLQEEVDRAKAEEDQEITGAAQKLLELLKAQPGGAELVQNTQTAIGNYIAQASGGSTASVNVHVPTDKK